jgi:hypothetical protein
MIKITTVQNLDAPSSYFEKREVISFLPSFVFLYQL